MCVLGLLGHVALVVGVVYALVFLPHLRMTPLIGALIMVRIRLKLTSLVPWRMCTLRILISVLLDGLHFGISVSTGISRRILIILLRPNRIKFGWRVGSVV